MSRDQGVPFDGTPHTISIGVRRLDLADWLSLEDRPDKVRQKQYLLMAHHDRIVATVPGSESGAGEVLDIVVDHLTDRGLVARTGSAIDDLESGLRWEVEDLHPIDLAARLVGEDLCLMEQRPDLAPGYVLTAASVSFPSRWRLADKIGTSLTSIHDPVPGYDAIARATERFFDSLSVDRPVRRVNWTLIDDPALFQPEPSRRHPDEAARQVFEDPAHQVHLRVERQTLRRLPATGGVLFTIDTQVRPLAELTPGQRADLAGSLVGVDAATQAYKGWSIVLPAVRAWAVGA